MNQSKAAARVKSLFKFFLGIPLTVLSFVFIFYLLYSSWDDVTLDFSGIDFSILGLGTLCLVFFFLLKAFTWTKLLGAVGHKIPFKDSFYLMMNSETKRYIPGNVFAVAARVTSFEKFGVSKKLLLATQVIEMAVLLMTSAIIAIPGVIYLGANISTIPFIVPLNQQLVKTLLIVLLIGLVIVLILSFVFIKRKLVSFSEGISYRDTFDAVFVSSLSWIFFGVGNFLVITSIFPLSVVEMAPLVSFFVLSWLVGFVSFFTPMGLGVREVVLTVGLTPIIGSGPAAAAAIFARILLVIAEILTLFVAKAVVRDKDARLLQVPWQTAVLGGSIVVYIFYFTYVSFQKHLNYLTGKFDLGNMDQTVWNTLNGRIFQLSDPNGVGMMSRLGVHSDFILVLFAPLYIVWQDPRMLLLVQTIVLGLGAVFVYLLANEILKNKTLGLVFGISFLLNFWVQRQNLFDFHAVVLGTTFLLGMFYFLVKKRYVWFSVFLVLAAFSKENVFLVLFFLGIYMFMKGYRKIGVVMSIASIVIFYVLVAYLIPHFRPQGNEHFGLTYFAALGDSPAEIITTAIFRPDIMTSIVAKNDGFFYFLQTLLPTGFLSLLSPLFLVFAAGDYLINVISDNYWLRTIFFHYGALIIPFVYISAIYGSKRLLRWRMLAVSEHTLIYYVLFFAIFSTWMYGVLPGSRWQSVGAFSEPFGDRDEITHVLSLLPEDLSVSASNTLAAHMSYREKIYIIPQGLDADIVAFLHREPHIATDADHHLRLLEEMKRNFEYDIVYSKDNFYVFVKRAHAPRVELLLSGE